MNESTWKMLDAVIGKEPQPFRDLGDLPNESEIDLAAAQLACRFCEDYVLFLKRYGAAFVGSYPIFGLRPIELMGNLWSVVEFTKWFREDDWPAAKDWYVVSTDGYGGSIGVDSDGRVLVADPTHGCIDELAPNFEQFLLEWCLKENDD